MAEPFYTSATGDRALARLHRCLGSRLLTGPEACVAYATDDSRILGEPPLAVVLAESKQDIQSALTIAEQEGIPVTPRAGGSGRTGGAVPIRGGLVLCTRGMNQLVELDREEGLAVVQPGVILEDLHRAVEAEGWFYPPDPNSSSVCCLAGNAAENAAGPRAFKYGVTRDYVLGVEAFLMGGPSFFAGRRTRKGVTGYDVTALLVGSEGTLATFGDLTLKLLPRPEKVMTLLALFRTMGDAARAVSRVIERRLLPRCIEFLDEKTLGVMRQFGNDFRDDAGALLIVEVDGAEEECLRQADLVGSACDDGGALEVVVAQTDSQRKKIWEARKQMSHAVRSRAADKLSEDVVVPRRHLATLVEEVQRLGERHRIDTLCYGHAGDGNLHVNFLFNDEEERVRVDRGIADLFRRTIELGGTLSGEHGIGLLKAPFLPLEHSPELIGLQRALKAQFDPHGLMNPGKIFPSGHGAC